MTAFKRGDVVLVRVPDSAGVGAALRPAVVLHPGLESDLGFSVFPLLPISDAGQNAIEIVRGSFESARMGLVTTLALDPDNALDLPKTLVSKVIGRCPYVLLDEAMRRRRSLLASASRFSDETEPVEDRPRAAEKSEAHSEGHSAKDEPQPDSEKAPAMRETVTTHRMVDAVPQANTAQVDATSISGVARVREDYSNRFPAERARYTCCRTPEPIEINGDLTKPVWLAAQSSNSFVDITTGDPTWFDTRVRLLWDDDYLYFGFTAEETDVWGTLTERDSKIYEENDLEIFIAGQDAYYEFEISARNVIYEAFWIWKDIHQPGGPYWLRSEFNPATERTMTLDGVGGHIHPRGERWGFLDWDMPGLKHAVQVQGTLNERDDTDFGWSAEIAIPWRSLDLLADGRSLPPEAGDVWRIDCSRFQKIGQEGESLDPCAGWTWNRHGHYDSHIPEVFPYVTFVDDEVKPGG